MMAALRTFLMLWLPGLAVLLAGLPPLLRTGQVDPLNWTWPALALALAVPAWFVARQEWARAVWMSAGAILMVSTLAWAAAGRLPAPAALMGLAAIIALVTAGGMVLVRRRIGLLFLAVAALGCWVAEQSSDRHSSTKPVLHVLTGLPLFWAEGQEGLPSRVDAPIVTVLRQDFDVRPIDNPSSVSEEKPRLLIAQPRAMSPQEIAMLDNLVRRGGTAVIFADPLLRWPSVLPLGDRRRAPSISLLQTLFEHWGVNLLPPAQGEPERRHFLNDGRVLTLYDASGFTSTGSACHVEEAGLIARCRIGKGSAVLIADADMIDDRLWLSDPARPTEERQWSADTPQFIARELGSDSQSARRWVRSGGMLVEGVRWSVMLGIFWAGLGIVIFGRRAGAPARRSAWQRTTESGEMR